MALQAATAPERSKEVLKEALDLISRHGTNYTPVSYAVWYEVASGTKPELKREVQSALANAPRLSADLTYDLFQKHVLEANERDLLASKARLEKVVADVQGSVSQTSATTESFQSSLNAFGEGIASSDSALFTGWLSERIGPPHALTLSGTVTLVAASIYLLKMPAIRRAIRPIYETLGIMASRRR